MPAASAGTYYVQVYGRYDVTGSFSLTPRDSLTPLTLDTPEEGAITRAGQLGLYQLNPGAGTHLFVLLEKPASWDCHLKLYHSALASTTPVDEAHSTGDILLEVPSCTSGLYYVLLFGRYGNTGNFTITARDALPEIPLDDGALTGQSITYEGDRNWYQIQAPEAKDEDIRLFVMFDKQGAWDTSVRLTVGTTDPSADLYNSHSTWDLLARAAPPAGAMCYVNIASRYGNTGSYRLKGMSHLTTLELNVPLCGQSLDDKGAVRWYEYDCSSGQHLFGRIDKPHKWECSFMLRQGVIPDGPDEDSYNGPRDGFLELASSGDKWVYLGVGPRYDQFGPFDISIRDHFRLLTAGDTLGGQSLAHSGDVKVYQVTVPADRQLTVTMEKPEAWDAMLMVRHGSLPDGGYDARAYGTGDLQAIVPSTQEGVYYITVSSRYSHIGDFTLTPTTTLATATASVPLAVSALACSEASEGVGIVVTLTADADVEAEILNIAGRLVARLPERRCEAGETTIIPWDRRSFTGTRVPAGRYLVRLRARAISGHEVSALAPLCVK